MLKILCCCFFTASYFIAPALDKNFNIAATYDESVNVVTISWKNEDHCVQEFILQRSIDEEVWIDLDTLYNSTEFMNREVSWEYRSPLPGGNSYRLKAVIDEYNFTCSLPVFVKAKPSLFEWNVEQKEKPDTLLLQYQGKGKIKGVINVLMQGLSGNIFYKARLASNTRSFEIPIANLGKGKYDIQIAVEGEVIWSQRFKKQTLDGGEMVCRLY